MFHFKAINFVMRSDPDQVVNFKTILTGHKNYLSEPRFAFELERIY